MRSKKIFLLLILNLYANINFAQINIRTNNLLDSALVYTDNYTTKYYFTYTQDGRLLKAEPIINEYNLNDNYERNEFSYDDAQKLIYLVVEYWNNNSWSITGKEIYKYDDNNNITEYTLQYYTGLEYENDTKVIMNYSPENLAISEYQYQWVNNEWANLYYTECHYNSNNLLDSVLHQDWNETLWQNSSLYTKVYDETDSLVSNLTQSWVGEQWINQTMDNYSYDYLNNSSIYFNQIWDGFDWINQQKEITERNENNQIISKTYQSWNTTDWTNDIRYTNTYNADNEIEIKLREIWNGSIWENSTIRYYYYDASGNISLMENFEWYGDWTILNSDFDFSIYCNQAQTFGLFYGYKTYLYYSEPSEIKDLNSLISKINIYPNPTKNILNIKTNLHILATIEIYDIKGKLIIKQELLNNSINLENLESGIYIIKIKDSDKTYTSKVIKN
jgi:hypothetical protein